MKTLIKKNLRGWKVLLFFALSTIIYTIMLTVTIPRVMSFSGGMKLLDMMPGGYDAAYVSALLSALGEEGRHAYLCTQIPMDMIYPLLFGVAYCLIMAWFLKLIGKADGRWLYLCMLPLAAGFFDYMENIGIILLLKTYPENATYLSSVANVFSILKSTLTTVTFIVLLILLATWGFRRILTKTSSST